MMRPAFQQVAVIPRRAMPTARQNRLKKLSKEYGQLEHWVTSHIKQIIPESVKTWWQEYRAALTKAETQQLGSNDVSEAVEMAGWGVEEAQERNRAEASKFMHLVPLML
ncbi:hypothetical protein COL922a_004176 [Colletotrichum nupharicola]|nr:hypothetical protein COL922a_004176 [Colletotrichum nupharicola]